jgi:hypothetical protein
MHGAHGHMVIHNMTQSARQRGCTLHLFKNGFFFAIVGILFGLMPVFNGFSSFLGDIGHFWSPNFGRKLGMDNRLQIYINQACLRPWKIERVDLC